MLTMIYECIFISETPKINYRGNDISPTGHTEDYCHVKVGSIQHDFVSRDDFGDLITEADQ